MKHGLSLYEVHNVFWEGDNLSSNISPHYWVLIHPDYYSSSLPLNDLLTSGFGLPETTMHSLYYH